MLSRTSDQVCFWRWGTLSMALYLVVLGADRQALGQESGADRSVVDLGGPRRVIAPEFPENVTWLNVAEPLRKEDLKGKFVILDFWTYCCINCMHILPELKKLEKAYPKQVVVIGVHSAKFDGERADENIRQAILRYEIEHPVINDKDHVMWNAYHVRAWPSLRIIDPTGAVIASSSGEFKFEQIDTFLKRVVPVYRKRGLIDETPLRFDRLAGRQSPSSLRFPGKVLADGPSDRLFITDSNHNRIVVTALDGRLIDTIGSGRAGRTDGSYREATFDHPQGLALHHNSLFVADTENHLIREVDLSRRHVTTVAGTGEQSDWPWPGLAAGSSDRLPRRMGGVARRTALSSPWALGCVGDVLYIAMAGSHQIWQMPLDQSVIGPYAGNGREDIIDGGLLPVRPYGKSSPDGSPASAFAQPSGLASDGKRLFVADSEGSSIRAVPLEPDQKVRTVVGTSRLTRARLFTFGDQDGAGDRVRLQHPLGVTYHGGKLYVADTYNNKIKEIDATSRKTRTLIRSSPKQGKEQPVTLNQPGGISWAASRLYVADTNHHRIVVVDPSRGEMRVLNLSGLTPPRNSPETSAIGRGPDFSDADQVVMPATAIKRGMAEFWATVEIELPEGWKMNPTAPMRYYLDLPAHLVPVGEQKPGWTHLRKPTGHFTVRHAVHWADKATVRLGVQFYYCQENGGGVCKAGSVLFTVPLFTGSSAPPPPIVLKHRVKR